ncbi:MAG: nicotinate phosphoribosyltransferase [Candidatus Moranbacteria bacterium]|nr:nicotinate phosphoribosyltransferase [Candidatus Moranbacteria bacterium]
MNNLFDSSDLPLTQFASSFAQGSVWLEEGMDKQIATFDLVARELPKNRNYLVYGGLEELVEYVKNLKYTDDQIQLLLSGNIITEKFAEYLRNFRFSGDIHAFPEGTVFFAGEPMVRITAPLIEASLIEIALFNITVSNVLFLSKASRIRSACKNKGVTLGMQRGHSFESGMKGLRSGYICGLLTTGWPNFVRKYHLPEKREYLISGQHFFIKSFPDEITAFRKLAQYFPDNTGFMVDTYNVDQGLSNAIIVGKELEKVGSKLRFVTIDSGDLDSLSRLARKRLDENNLASVKILAATNLNEKKIKKLIEENAPIDFFIVATEYVTALDAPSLEVVYKMAEIRDGEKIRYTAKLAQGKTSYPGRKQVFREFEKGLMKQDVVGLEDEKHGTPLLREIVRNGNLVSKLPELDEIRQYFDEQLMMIPELLLDVEHEQNYQVVISDKIQDLLTEIKNEHDI